MSLFALSSERALPAIQSLLRVQLVALMIMMIIITFEVNYESDFPLLLLS